jgi:hypothetical protein
VGVSWRTASAATDLGTVPAAQAAAWLLDLAQNSSNDRLQAVAFVAANSADSARIAERLFSLAGDKRFARDVRSRSLRWLAEAARRENRSDEAERVQRAIIRDAGDAATVRERAIRELEPTEANEAFLRETYRDVSVMVLKERIIRTLAASGDSTSARWLREIAVSSEEPLEARDRALRVLAEQGAPSAELVSLYERVQGPSLRQRVVKVLVERGDDVAIEKLMQIADRDPDPAQRRYVLRRLSEMQNPKARVFLEGKVVR